MSSIEKKLDDLFAAAESTSSTLRALTDVIAEFAEEHERELPETVRTNMRAALRKYGVQQLEQWARFVDLMRSRLWHEAHASKHGETKAHYTMRRTFDHARHALGEMRGLEPFPDREDQPAALQPRKAPDWDHVEITVGGHRLVRQRMRDAALDWITHKLTLTALLGGAIAAVGWLVHRVVGLWRK